MSLSVSIKKQSFVDPVAFPDVALTPERYSWMALGGPDFAEIRAAGELNALWSLLNWLRVPVEITDERDEAVWWGYVDEVTVRTGAIEVGVSLRQMANRVAVAYSYIPPGSNSVGTRATTAWAQADDSVATYGAKELLNSRDGCSADAAEARRDAILDRLKYPIPQVTVAHGAGRLEATLRCLGWWHSLDWTQYSRNAGLEEHTDGTINQAVGAAAGNAQLAQSFQLTGGEAWDAASVALELAVEGSPTDTLYVDLCADSGGAPGSVLATGSQAGSSLSTTSDWVTFTLNSEVALALGTPYWVVVRRSGAVDGGNHYVVTVDEGLGYASGVLRLWNGSSWVARATDADLAFKVEGVEETTAQIAAVVDAEGQFLTGVDIRNPSGVRSNQYRDGDTTALQVLEALATDGTSAGKRLLATVTRDRVVQVYAEPDASQVTLRLGVNGRLQDKWGNELLPRTCPVAQWCELKDVVPATVNTTVLAAPSPFFIERAEFDVARLVWMPEARNTPSPWEIGELIDV